MAKKHYPVVKRAQLSSTSESVQTRILQVDQELSKLNRRLMRQGRYYSVKIEQEVPSSDLIEVYVLRDDWAVQKAYQLGYTHYQRNIADELASMSDSQKARWRDFRVNHGVTGLTTQMQAKLFDSGLGSSILTLGEFELANVTDSAGTVKTFDWSTASAGSVYSLLQEYDRAGDAQGSPNNAAFPGPYENIDATQQAATYDHLQDDGNDPPYDKDGVNTGSPWTRVAVIGSVGGVQKLSTGFFTAPCGIVVLVGSSPTWNSDTISFEAKAGDYKGVHAPSMLE